MKKIFRIFFLVLCLFTFITNCSAKEKIKLYFFHGKGCPHCAEEEKYLKKISKNYSNIEIVKYEVWYDEDNQELMKKVKDKMKIENEGVPLTIIGKTSIVGYSENTSLKIDRAINYYNKNNKDYINVVGKIKNNTLGKVDITDNFSKKDSSMDSDMSVKVPLVGKVNMKNVSLSTAAAIIGFIDGFNPCAMWVLLFLISILLGMKNKFRKWTLGVTFILSSALVYMAIMFSWINIVVNVSTSIIFRYVIALVSIVGSFVNLRSYIKEIKRNDGCEVIDNKKRKKILTRIKKFTREKSLIFALIGVIGLAFSVNIVELACSAGLPVMFTELLNINNVSGLSSLGYMLIYIFFFLIDDIVVFSIAMATTEIKSISTKYNKYSHLIGGIIMLIMGILLIFKPEWLMFNF